MGICKIIVKKMKKKRESKWCGENVKGWQIGR